MIPFAELRETRAARSRGEGLIRLRTIHLSMVLSLALLVVALGFVEPGGSNGRTPLWVWIGIGATTGIALSEIYLTGKRLDRATDEEVAARGYSVMYFLRLGFSYTPPVSGIALWFVTGTRVTYLVPVMLGEILLWLIAPSRRNLRLRTERFRAAGKDIDMTRALLSVGPPSPDVAE